MKIEFLTQDDPLYILPLFEELIRNYHNDWQVTCVLACRTMGKRSRKQLITELIDLYGLPAFVRLASSTVLSRLFGKLPRKAGAARYASMEQLFRAYGIEYASIGNPNDPSVVAAIAERKPDLIVSVACPYILKRPLLELAPLGAINIHHAPLPRYRGMMPTFWQMFHGETHSGLTIHYMVPEVDEGEAVFRDALEIRQGETLHELIIRAKRHGACCLGRVLRMFAEGRKPQPLPPLPVQGSYFTFPNHEQIRQFHDRGLRSI
jgi:methionyl-tRNA formyltransferase